MNSLMHDALQLISFLPVLQVCSLVSSHQELNEIRSPRLVPQESHSLEMESPGGKRHVLEEVARLPHVRPSILGGLPCAQPCFRNRSEAIYGLTKRIVHGAMERSQGKAHEFGDPCGELCIQFLLLLSPGDGMVFVPAIYVVPKV